MSPFKILPQTTQNWRRAFPELAYRFEFYFVCTMHWVYGDMWPWLGHLYISA